MKRLLKSICILLSLAFAFTAITFCWFSRGTLLNFRTEFGSAKASYFESGDGSAENAYVISSPTHFYNFAWLQYLGYFNHSSSANNGRYQSYFKLKNDIDMSELKSALPPIGTSRYPFIGNFNGNGYTITNVSVSNKLSGAEGEADKNYLKVRPSAVDNLAAENDVLPVWDDTANTVDVVGLFGITGDKDGVVLNDYKDGSAEGAAGALKDTVRNPAQPDTSSKDSAYYGEMKVSNFYADYLSVKSASQSTLVGLAAGYANAAIENVGVYRCGITVNANATGLNGSDSVSKYSLLGDYNEEAVSWAEKPGAGGSSGDDNAWGGSIDMRTLNRRLNYMYSAGTKSGAYTGREYSKGTNFNLSGRYYDSSYPSYKLEYFWNNDYYETENKTVYNGTMYLLDGTLLPLNINTEAMGLTKTENGKTVIDKTEKTVTSTWQGPWSSSVTGTYHINDEYEAGMAEPILDSNTGYLVGNGSSVSEASVRAGMIMLAMGAKGGIYQSFKGATTSDLITYDDSTKAGFALFTLQGSGSEWTTYRIVDDVNINEYTAGDTEGNVTNRTYSDLKLTQFKKVRENYDFTMDGSKIFHGFHFLPKIPAGTNQRADLDAYVAQKDGIKISGSEMSGYEFVKGGLNFTVKEQGYITTIVSGGYADAHSLFALYKVERDSDHKIKSLIQIEKIYRKVDDNEKISYVYNDATGGTLAFDIGALSSSSHLTKKAAYYFEIPVEEGDYVIGAAAGSTDTNGYLSYLDIGANGSGDSGGETPEQKPYSIATLDFVNDTSDTGFSKAYADVTAEIKKAGTKDSSITFERQEGDDKNDDGEINTAVYYVLTNFNVSDVVFTPDNLSIKAD